MSTAQVLPIPRSAAYDETSRADRQEIVDSVLGTMNAEGEPPSPEAQALMQKFVEGELTMDEMSQAILAHASRMVHEANGLRLTV